MLATATVITLAYRSPGYAVTSVNLNDGGIWVTRNSAQDVPVARFDKPVEQLGEGLTPPGGPEAYDVEVYQSGADVLLLDRRRGVLYSVNPQAVVPVPSTPDDALVVPSGNAVSLGGDTVAILDSKLGNLWAAPFSQLSLTSPTQTHPIARVGPTAAATVGLDGAVYAASAVRHRLDTLPAGESAGRWTALPTGFVSSAPQLTVVGSTAVLLDPASRQILIRPTAS